MLGSGRPAEPILVWGRHAGRDTALPFDARELIGLELTEAEALAERHCCLLRVLVHDGHHVDRRDDLRLHRINVATVDSVVVDVLGAY